MPPSLETAIAEASTLKTQYQQDIAAIAAIEASVLAAGLPLASAQTQAQNRRQRLNTSMDALASAAIASKV